MLKRKIHYTDYNGDEQDETHYFNLSKLELMELELFGGEKGGSFTQWIRSISESNDRATLFAEFKKLILASYGKKSEDGRSFIKNDELRDAFKQTAAFESLFMELATVTDAAIEFVRGVVPAEMAGSVPDNVEDAQAILDGEKTIPQPPARNEG